MDVIIGRGCEKKCNSLVVGIFSLKKKKKKKKRLKPNNCGTVTVLPYNGVGNYVTDSSLKNLTSIKLRSF